MISSSRGTLPFIEMDKKNLQNDWTISHSQYQCIKILLAQALCQSYILFSLLFQHYFYWHIFAVYNNDNYHGELVHVHNTFQLLLCPCPFSSHTPLVCFTFVKDCSLCYSEDFNCMMTDDIMYFFMYLMFFHISYLGKNYLIQFTELIIGIFKKH